MTRRALFAAAAALPLLARLRPGKPTSGVTINGTWWPSLDYYLAKHDGVLENGRCVMHSTQEITVPFRRIVGNYFEAPDMPPAPLLSLGLAA